MPGIEVSIPDQYDWPCSCLWGSEAVLLRRMKAAKCPYRKDENPRWRRRMRQDSFFYRKGVYKKRYLGV